MIGSFMIWDTHIHIDLGCEMFCHPGNVLNCISKLKDGTYPSFGHYVLTELPTYGIGLKDALFCVNKVQEDGVRKLLDLTSEEQAMRILAGNSKARLLRDS